MYLRIFFLFLLLILVWEVGEAEGGKERWRADRVARRGREVAAVRSVIRSSWKASPHYRLPTWESALSVFGLRTHGDAHVSFIRPRDNSSFSIAFKISESSNETQIEVEWEGDRKVYVSREIIRLSIRKFTWFSIYRKGSIVALFQEGLPQPLLVYNYMRKVDFLECVNFQVRSKNVSLWDFCGDHYLSFFSGRPAYRSVQEEVYGAARGLAYMIMTIDYFLRSKRVEEMSATLRNELAAHLDRLNSYFLLCKYHAFDFIGENVYIPMERIKHARIEMSRNYLETGKKK